MSNSIAHACFLRKTSIQLYGLKMGHQPSSADMVGTTNCPSSFKGSLTRDFVFRSFSWICFPWAPEYPIGTISNPIATQQHLNKIRNNFLSQKFSHFHRCQRHRWSTFTFFGISPRIFVKIWNGLNGISGPGGNLFMKKALSRKSHDTFSKPCFSKTVGRAKAEENTFVQLLVFY